MNTWQGAKLLVKYDWMSIGYGWLFNIAMLLYFILTSAPLVVQLSDLQQGDAFTWPMDFVMLAIVPVMGFFMNITTIGNWKEARVARKIARFRLLPISYRQIAAGRLLTMLTVFTPSLAIYFTSQYIIAYHEVLEPLPFLNFCLQWFGYGIAIGCIYAYLELSLGGKAYFWTNLAIVLLLAAVSTLMAVNKFGLVLHQVERAQAGDWTLAVIALAAAAITFIGIIGAIASRLSRRNLLG